MMEQNEKIVAIIGLTEAIKQYGIPSQYAPTIAIIVGAVIGYVENPTSQGVLNGVLLGGIVTGGYAVTKRAGQGVLSTFQKPPTTIITEPVKDYSTLEPDDYRGV